MIKNPYAHYRMIGPFVAVLLATCFAQQAGSQDVRMEEDLLGKKAVPGGAFYGIQTARAIENFQISGRTLQDYPALINGFAVVKMAAALANRDAGKMKPETCAAIQRAGQAILAGQYHDQFPVDPYQGGAGTSTNMNANEVMANVALKLAGHALGSYEIIEPHDDLNMSQSTNDCYPTALKVAILTQNGALIEELEKLVQALRKLGDQHRLVLKMGRTEMQDAVPMTVGQEFHAFAAGIEVEIQNLRKAEQALLTINMGATAIGTGINTPAGYADKVPVHLSKLTGKQFSKSDDLIAATWDQHGFVVHSSSLRSLAIKLSKIASDLILLSSGPRAGLAEINLPALQPGSSIMPGKVNPVIPELVNLVCFRVIANDNAVTLCAQSGQLQLNAYEPLEAISTLESQSLMINTMKTLREKCIEGITINRGTLDQYMRRTVGIVTALNPVIGYEAATELAREAYRTDKGILEIIRQKKVLTEEQIKQMLDPASLTGQKPADEPTKKQ